MDGWYETKEAFGGKTVFYSSRIESTIDQYVSLLVYNHRIAIHSILQLLGRRRRRCRRHHHQYHSSALSSPPC